jgi:hypothetical protein
MRGHPSEAERGVRQKLAPKLRLIRDVASRERTLVSTGFGSRQSCLASVTRHARPEKRDAPPGSAAVCFADPSVRADVEMEQKEIEK